MSDLRKACAHGKFDPHSACSTCDCYGGHCYWHSETPICPGGTSVSVDDLKEALGPDFMIMRKIKVDYPENYPTL